MFSSGIIQYSATTQFATWSPTNKSSRVTLTNSNLTFTGASASQQGTCISTIGKSSGKWYWEVTINANASNETKIGIANYVPVSGNIYAVGNQPSAIGSAYGYRGNPWCVTGPFQGSPNLGTGCIAQAAGQILSIALDLDGSICRFYVNGVLRYTVNSIGAGTWYPACASDGSNGQGTANFGAGGAGSFTYFTSTGAQAAGYNPGIYI